MSRLLPLVIALTGACAPAEEEAEDTAVELTDDDGDGWPTPVDCEDQDSGIHPGAPELCNRIDDDCDGVYDDHPWDGYTAWLDFDGDGYGADDSRDTWCGARDLDGRPWVMTDGDCDDTSALVNPGARETCATEVDDDCDGGTNDANAIGCTPFFEDTDGDGVGTEQSACLCEAAASWTAEEAGDCDDGDATATEGCSGAGAVTMDDADTWFFGAPGLKRAGDALAAGDLDEDGTGDVVVSTRGASPSVLVMRGPFDAQADLGAADARFDADFISGGVALDAGLDLDADGTSDILLASWDTTDADYVTDAWLLPGATDGLLPVASATLEHTSSDQSYVAAAGMADATGDGLADLLLAGPTDGIAWVLAGPWQDQRDLTDAFLVAAPAWRTSAAAPVGDTDGDGLDDFAVAVVPPEGGAAVLVFSAAADGTVGLDYALANYGTTAAFTVNRVAGAGDVNGDGSADLAVAGYDAVDGVWRCVTRIYAGPLAAEGDLEDATAGLEGGALDTEGWALAGPMDLDGDGYSDLAVGTPGDDTWANNAGATWIFYGPLEGSARYEDADWRWYGTAFGDDAGAALTVGHDLDGDGRDELLIGLPGSDRGAVAVGAAVLVSGVAR